jgi:uncharacterized protein (TIGR03067 family)
MSQWLAVAVALGVPLGADVPGGGAAREDGGKLRGTWVAVSATRDGKPAKDLQGHRLRLLGDKFVIRSRGGKVLYRGTYRLDGAAKPARFDFRHTEGALKGKVWKGIYVLQGDTLKTCDNGPDPDKGRPKKFAAPRGSGYVLIHFERAPR